MLMTYYAKLAYYRFISSIRGYTGFRGRGGGCSGEISGSAHVLFCDTATQYCTIVHVTNCMLVLGSQ